MTDRFEAGVATALRRQLDALPVAPGDPVAARRRGQRLRTMRRSGTVVTVTAVLTCAVLLWTGGPARDPHPAPPATGSWSEGTEAPLSPRWSPVGVWTGEEVLFLGGGIDTPCPPNADCAEPDAMASDGAAYDPDTDTWRRIADAPALIGYWARAVLVGDLIVVQDERRFFVYDIAEDAWKENPVPGGQRVRDTGGLTASNGEVYVLAAGREVLALDPEAGTWRALPPAPLRPDTVVATPGGIYVSGRAGAPGATGQAPDFTVVHRWDGAAWRLVTTTGQIGSRWHWTGERLVDLDPQRARGLTGQPPYGGVLDPATGDWRPLPNAPDPERDDLGDGWSVTAAAGPLLAGWRSVYDDRTERWTRLGKPGGTTVDSGQTGVWADGRLVVFGGLDEAIGYADVAGLSNSLWVWTP